LSVFDVILRKWVFLEYFFNGFLKGKKKIGMVVAKRLYHSPIDAEKVWALHLPPQPAGDLPATCR